MGIQLVKHSDYRADLETNLYPFARQENEEIEDIINTLQDSIDEEEGDRQNQTTRISFSARPYVLPDKVINEKI